MAHPTDHGTDQAQQTQPDGAMAPGAFEDSITVRAYPDKVVDFIGDIRNLPKYVPTTQQAMPQGPGRVRVAGEAHGHPYDSDGYLRCDRAARRLEWGADEGHYSGMLLVEPASDDESIVTCRLMFRQRPGSGPTMPSDDDIREGLRRSLESIRNHMEGTGGKVEPAAATGGSQETTSGM